MGLFTKNYMPWNQISGTPAELRVKEWLAKKSFSLINQNWRSCYGEIDIIASFMDQLHFIVVTTMTCTEKGLPAQGITRKKMLACKQAAQKYLERHPLWKKIIFDVLAIPDAKEEAAEPILIKNVQPI